MVVQLFAVTADGPVALPIRPGVESAHQLFDGLPLGAPTPTLPRRGREEYKQTSARVRRGRRGAVGAA